METFTLQATGHLPITVHGRLLGASLQKLDSRRAIEVKLYERDENTLYEGLPFVGELKYLTQWPTERIFNRLIEAPDFPDLCERMRQASTHALPPGAGYPATELYRERQRKLEGQMHMLALDALTFAISQAQLVLR